MTFRSRAIRLPRDRCPPPVLCGAPVSSDPPPGGRGIRRKAAHLKELHHLLNLWVQADAVMVHRKP